LLKLRADSFVIVIKHPPHLLAASKTDIYRTSLTKNKLLI